MTCPEAVGGRLSDVKRSVHNACVAADRKVDSVCLIAVSKRQPTEAIRAAYAAGQRDFGENYAQEMATKAAQLSDLTDIRWHFVGPLQRNKVGILVDCGATLHTAASKKLLDRVDRVARDRNKSIDTLIQINLANEISKSGILETDLDHVVEHTHALANVRCIGLMTMPPAAASRDELASIFERLAELAAVHHLPELSIGMSQDFDTAIACGSTMIRVGTRIFGPRST